jgi:hypothetical protein
MLKKKIERDADSTKTHRALLYLASRFSRSVAPL